MDQRARHSRCSRNPFRAGHVFGATLVRNCYGLSGCWPPSTDLTGLPANGGFYFQAFSGSVALPAAGYNYNSVWTPLLAGLPPAGMAASLAALVHSDVLLALDKLRGYRNKIAHTWDQNALPDFVETPLPYMDEMESAFLHINIKDGGDGDLSAEGSLRLRTVWLLARLF